MLKSTHKPLSSPAPPSVPEGWTEHKAPTGHTYYYNAATKVSTYTRPQVAHPASVDGAYTSFDRQLTPDIPTLIAQSFPDGQLSVGATANGHSHRNPSFNDGNRNIQPRQPRDRPKSRVLIPGCEPWLLVKTKLGRRFVYNPDSDKSFWRFPPNVMRAVVEHDRQEREKRQKIDHEHVEDRGTVIDVAPTAAPKPSLDAPAQAEGELASDEEYEEVEVTDDEAKEGEMRRQGPRNPENDQPVEFDEDDIAYQLQAMGQDYVLNREGYDDGEAEDLEDEEEGLPLTEHDRKALFKDMLNDYQISPYTTWDALIETGHIVEDDRYTVMPNMRSRKEVWAGWSRDRIQLVKEQREQEAKKDPRIPYFAFLQARATPKLYWPEFRRKYQKEPEMRNNKLMDKDREKWYREYINRLKLPESTLKADFVQTLQSLPLHLLNSSNTLESLPPALLIDLRYISLRQSVRDPLIEAHLRTLAPAPASFDFSPEEIEHLAKEKQERERREIALTERQRRVREEKKRQQGALRYGKDILREGEHEVERAMKIGKQGLLSHMDVDSSREGG